MSNDFSWDLRALLKVAIGTYRVPGASIAVFANGVLHEAAAGVLNAETGVEATTDSLFHILDHEAHDDDARYAVRR